MATADAERRQLEAAPEEADAKALQEVLPTPVEDASQEVPVVEVAP